MPNEFKVKNGLIVDQGGAFITGSSSISGSLSVTGSFTASLQSGYVWVGDGSGITRAVTTSSFIAVFPAGLVSGSSQVVGILTSLNSYTASNDTTNTTQNSRLTNLETTSASLLIETQNLELFSASALNRLTNLETKSSSVDISITNLNASSASQQSSINSLSAGTASVNSFTASTALRLTNLETTSASVNGHITDINSKTGSYARTNVSNIFSVDQTITGSLYISANLIVQGSSSLNVISQSTLNIGTNLITVNVQNPSSRFGGLAVIDSGSSPQRSGSWLFDSINDNWIFIHQNAANITSSVALMGAPTYNNVGNETYPTQNRLVKGLGYEHIGDSNILDTGTEISLNSLTSVTGSFVVSGNITGTIRATNGIVSGSSQISLAGTSDYTSLFGGIASATSSLNLFTASNANTSLNSFTASAALRLTNLETTSASVNISVSNLNTYSASVSNSIQQLNIFTSSAALRLTNLETTSASVNISITNLNTYSASVSNSIGNINAFTSSENTKSSTLATYTGSNDTKWSTLQNVTSSLIARTGSYATTGSNSFLGNQTITGSLVLSGSLNVIGGAFFDSGGFNRGGTQAAYSIAMGSGQGIGLATATGGNDIAIGAGASSTGVDAVVIGTNAVGGNYSIAMGRGVTSATNEFVVGQTQSPITTMIVGSSRLGLSNAAGNNLSITPSPGNGSNFAGGSITIAGGRGTGTGSSGDVIFATAISTTAGSTLQTSIQRWWIKGETGTLTNKGTSSLAALDISGSSIFTGSINITGSLNILGNVGIGTSAPIARLNIVGSGSTLSTNTLVVQNSTPSTLFLIRDDGNVGIGTNSPSYSLDVNGGISAKMPSYNSTGFQILNADGVADWKIINAGSTTTDRPFIQVPRWSTGTPIIISNSSRNQGAVNDAIMIGGGVPNNGDVLANRSIRIGKNSNTLIGTGAIVIGTGNAQGDYSISISSDQYGIPVGNVPNNNSFWIGSSVEGATNEANQGVLDAINVYIGRPARSSSFTGNLAQGTATSINGMGGYGTTNSTGGNLTINGGVGLGSGTPGDVIIGTATPTTSGTTLQTLTDRVWIKNSTGNVGIGTSTPNSKLDVSGSTIITNALAIGTSSLGSTENTLTIGLPPAGGTGEGGQILLQASGGLYTSASMLDNWQNQFRILRGSNVGSDATIANWNMHTRQMQLPAYNSVSAFAGTAVANLAVNSSGDVITVSTTGGSVFPYTGNAQINGGLGVTGSIATSTIFLATNTNGAAYLRGGDDVELWDINISNHIGIYGQQDQTVASIKLGSGGGIISGKNGNIGIGTINPSSGSLHVTGSIFAASITGAIAATNGVVSGSSQVIGILSSLNTYTGSNDTTNTAQNSRLTNLESKSASVDISITNLNASSASQQISIDSINSKTGSFATTGSNTFIGNQTISGSVFISGSLTSSSDIRVSGHTLGRGAGFRVENTVLGFEALGRNTTATRNTAVGWYAISASTTNGSNTAVGAVTQRFNTGGTGNSSLGEASLFSLTTGNFNSALGQSALGSVTDGTNNVGIGYYAGDTLGDGSTANSTPDNSIYIGYLAYASQSNGQNEIVIGASNVGHGSNTVTLGNSSITRTILRGSVTASSFTSSADSSINDIRIGKGIGGVNNMVIGSGSFLNAGVGSIQNIAIGIRALASATNGETSSVAIGYHALSSSNAPYNTAVGAFAASFSTTVQNVGRNNAFGYASLYNNVSGECNTAIGSYSLFKSKGSYNTAVGDYSLFGLINPDGTVGRDNTGIGHAAGFTLITGNNNTFLGKIAGNGITTGSNNTIIGSTGQLEINTIGIVTGSNNTIIGANISGLATTLNNNIILSDGQGNIRIRASNTGQLILPNYTTTTSYAGTAAGVLAFDSSGNILTIATPGGSATAGGSNGSIQFNDSTALSGSSRFNFDKTTNSVILTGSLVITTAESVTNPTITISTIGTAGGAGSNLFIGTPPTTLTTAGVNNIGIGRTAADALTSGAGNVALGAGALSSITFGSDNVAIGRSALAAGGISINQNSGSNNVVIGSQALLGAADTSHNAVVGAFAMVNNSGDTSTSGHNTALGSNAGRYYGSGVDILSDSTGSIYIGAFSRGSNFLTINEIVIGSNAIGSGNNTVTIGNTSVTNTYLRGQVSASAFSGSLFGTSSWARNALTASFINPLVQNVTITGSIVVSGSSNNVPTLQLFGSGSTILTISGSNSELFKVVDTPTSPILATISTGSLNVLTVTTSSVIISGALLISGSMVFIPGGANELTVGPTGVTLGNSVNDIHRVTGSFNITGSFSASLANGYTYVGGADNITKLVATSSFGGGLRTKAGSVANTSFSGNPKKVTVTFSTAFPNTNYAINVTGEDARSWTIETKLAGSFIINTNSNTALDGTTYWIATAYGETA